MRLIPRKWWILAAMTGSLSMTVIDQTIVSVALPRIQRDLDASQVSIQWVINAYILALAATIAVGGRIGDLCGRRKTFLRGVVLFAGASACCGMAVNESMIIAARVFQGLGAALMQPASAAIVMNTFELRERGKAMAIYAGITMAFMALGPLLGGILTQYVSWRWAFYINLPVAALTIILVTIVKPENKKAPVPSFDFAGCGLLIAGAPALVLGIQQGHLWGWTSPTTTVLILGGIAVLGVFALVESRRENPLIEIRLFKDRCFSVDTAMLSCMKFALIAQVVFGSIYMQNVLGFGPFKAGLAILAIVVPIAAMSQFAGRVYDRIGVKVPATIGTALACAGFFLQAALLSTESLPMILPGMVILGLGMGLVMAPANTDALNRAPGPMRGQASGLIQTFRQMGGSVGLAVIGGLIATVERSKMARIVADSGGSAADGAKLGGLLSESAGEQIAAIRQLGLADAPRVIEDLRRSLAQSISAGYCLAGAALAMAFLLALLMLRPGPPSEKPSLEESA